MAQVWIYRAADDRSPMKLTRAADVRHIEQDRELLQLHLEGGIKVTAASRDALVPAGLPENFAVDLRRAVAHADALCREDGCDRVVTARLMLWPVEDVNSRWRWEWTTYLLDEVPTKEAVLSGRG